ncbi:MAG: HEAT repeat domain-containing protein, partial [Phycisphaerales bacterium]
MSIAERLSCLLVAALISSAGTVAAATSGQEKRVDELIGRLGQRDWQSAVDALAEIGEPAIESIVHILKDTSIKTWSVQARAINVLQKIGTKQAVGVIVDSLQDTEANQYVRGSAAIALGRTGSAEVVEPLRLGLEDEKQFVRWKCTQALGMLGYRECVGGLVMAAKDRDPYVRAAAVQALGTMKSKDAVDDLVRAFADEHWLVRLNARNGMVEIGEPAAERLIGGLKDSDSRVRWQAAWALGRIKATAAVAPLIETMGDSNWMVRDEAAVALVRIDSETLVDLLIKASEQGIGYVREQAAWALAEMKRRTTAEEYERRETLPKTSTPEQIECNQKTYPCYPKMLDSRPDIPSPYTAPDGTEVVTAYMKDGKFALVPVTLENGEPLNYKESKWGKGRQLAVDSRDFPTLARTGLHSETELSRTKMITGRSVVEITDLGRPGRSSGAGFIGNDEDIVSVLKADNAIVSELDLRHPQMARPLFHIWNMILTDYRLGRLARFWDHIEYIYYNGTKVFLKAEGTRGWQESLFNDEILGMYQFEAWRQLSPDEKAFLREKYPHLTEEQMAEFVKKLSHIHSGEMVPYYIMRYGFYEGHTDYRA